MFASPFDIAFAAPQPAKPIIYMSRTAAEHIINGHFPIQLLPLDGADYRKPYEDLSLTEEQARAFQILNAHLVDYPYAVVTRETLFYRTDDNCSVIGDKLGGVNISEACRSHDYCYRKLISPVGSEGAYQDFIRCNNQFSEDILQICRDNGKDCSLNRVYETVLRRVSYVVFRIRQSNQAEMIGLLIKSLKNSSEELKILMKTDIFSFPELLESYQKYCSQMKRNSKTDIYASEKKACKTLNN